MNRKKYSYLIAVFTALLIAACTAGKYEVVSSQLTVVNPNQNILGDKPYIAVIRFQSTFSVEGSTTVVPNVELTQLGSRMRGGDTAAIPASIGFKSYPIVARFSKEEVTEQGKNPTIYGTIIVGMEEDLAGEDQVREAVLDTARVLEESLARHIELGAWNRGLGLGVALNDISADLTSDPDGGGCGLADTRVCTWFRERIGDDLIGRAFYAAVNIDAEYYEEVSHVLNVFSGRTWPGCDHESNPICYVRNETRTLDLTGENAGHYQISMSSTYQTGS